LQVKPGIVPFKVFENCVWPHDQRVAIGVHLDGGPVPSRSRVQALLEDLWAQARAGLGERFPRVVQICVFQRPGGWSPDFVGCLNRGFEPAGEEDEGADAGEERPELQNHAPFSPDEEARRIEAALSTHWAARAAPRTSVNDAKHELTVRFEWAARPGCNEVLSAFFELAWTFYPTTTQLGALRVESVWKGKALLSAHVADEKAFLAMDPWPLRQKPEPGAMRAALKRLPMPESSAHLDAALCR
jgi:hypothetical protein